MMSSPLTRTRSALQIIQPKDFPGLPQNWTSDWETIPSAEGQLQLYVARHAKMQWVSPRVLLIVHGLGEHGGRYLHFPHYLQSTFDAVYCVDLRGHGCSEGLRGHVDSFDLYCEDTAWVIQRIHEQLLKRFGRSEIHVFGHSMGGLIVLRTLLKRANQNRLPVASCLMSAPALALKIRVPFLKQMLGRVLKKIWGSVHFHVGLDPHFLSHDPAVLEAYGLDRLIHQKVTPQFFSEFQKAMMSLIQKKGLECPYPLMWMVPLEDFIIDSQVTLDFYASLVGDAPKLLKVYPDSYHEIFNDFKKEQAFQDLESWVQSLGKGHDKNT